MKDRNLTELVKQAALRMTRQCWEQGILSQAFLESGDTDNLQGMVDDSIRRQSKDGRLCNIEDTPAYTDSAFCIPSVLAMYEKTGDVHYREAALKNLEFLKKKADRTADGVLIHMRGTTEIWADSAAYMPYSFALAGDYEEACFQMNGILNKLYDPETGLYCHMWDDSRRTFKRKGVWGVGNGWILTGLLRLHLALPDSITEKEITAKKLRSLLDRILAYRTVEGRFHDILNDENTFLETETAEMIAYTIYRGVGENVLDRTLLPIAHQIREEVVKCVDSEGKVHSCAGSPDFVKSGVSVEGQAHFVMMESAFMV